MEIERTDMRNRGRIRSAPSRIVEHGSAWLRYRPEDPSYDTIPDTSDPGPCGANDPAWPRMSMHVSPKDLESSPYVIVDLWRHMG